MARSDQPESALPAFATQEEKEQSCSGASVDGAGEAQLEAHMTDLLGPASDRKVAISVWYWLQNLLGGPAWVAPSHHPSTSLFGIAHTDTTFLTTVPPSRCRDETSGHDGVLVPHCHRANEGNRKKQRGKLDRGDRQYLPRQDNGGQDVPSQCRISSLGGYSHFVFCSFDCLTPMVSVCA